MAVVVHVTAEGWAHMDELAAKVANRVTRDVERDARRRCPVDTGELVGSIHSVTAGPDGRVYVGTDHWAPTEYGSGPHIIRAHGPYSLHNRETGQYFGPVVHHPGTPEQPFMRPAIYTRRAIVAEL